MTGNQWRLLILAVVLASAGIYQWVGTIPTWYLYHKEYPMVRSVEEFDTLMVEVQNDVEEQFYTNYPVDLEAARDQVAYYLREPDPNIVGCFIDAWVWVWEGSDMKPSWPVCGEWHDTWRRFDYGSPETKQAQFCMMGFTPAPIP